MAAPTVTRGWLREYFRYEDGNLYAIKHRPHSRVLVGDKLGYVHSSGRVRAVLFGRKYGLHQLIWIYHNGALPEFGIDHEDRNPANNRIGNLRECTAKTNAENQAGIRGVHKEDSGRFSAKIGHNGKNYYLGTYDTEEEAISVRQAKERELFTHSPLHRT